MKKTTTLFALIAATSFSYSCEKKPDAAAPAAPAAPAPAAPAVPAADAKPAGAAGDVAKIMLGVTPAVMKFDKTEFEVKAGQKVMILFKNAGCPLQHNILISKPGTKDKIGAEADKMLADPNALKANYFPNSTDVLFKGTKLVGIGQSDLMEFTAPSDEGDYPFICTFPGHWRTMNGVMKVKK